MKVNLELNNGSDICVVMGYNDDYQKLGDITSYANLAYCMRQKYDFRLYREGFDLSRHPSWSKLLFVRDALYNHKWVYWIDGDAVFTNYLMPITRYIQLGGDIYVGAEREMFNFGTFLIRNCEWTHYIINEMWAYKVFAWRWPWEQQAFNECFFKKQVENHVVYFAMKEFCTILLPEEWNEALKWKPGDFAAHCWGKRTQEEKIQAIKSCLQEKGV